MTPSTLTWLDHDSSEQEHMRRVLQLFEEKGTMDELGIGGIRSSIADQLFPGTSTIQTRLRYFLFVPWVYERLEESRISGARLSGEARALQARLCDALLKGGEELGVIGGRRGGWDIIRTPDVIYWNGLGIWGIRRYPGSKGQYQDDIERIYRLREMRRMNDDGSVEVDSRSVTWHSRLPSAPEGWLEEVTMDLTLEEADFLQERIRVSCAGSLLAFLAEDPREGDFEAPWKHAEYGSFPNELQSLLHHARLFSLVIEGAVLLYNVMLARKAGREEVVEGHETAFQEWAQELDAAEIRAWDLEEFWCKVRGHGYRITPVTQSFVDRWVELVRTNKRKIDAPATHALIEYREKRLKGPHARLDNPRALDQWGGASGLGRLTFRWSEGQRYINELAAGLARA